MNTTKMAQKKPFGSPYAANRAATWRDDASTNSGMNSGSGFKKTPTTEQDGWNHVGSSQRDKPNYNSKKSYDRSNDGASGGTGHSHARNSKPSSSGTTPNFFKINMSVDNIMKTSGDLKTIESRLTDLIMSRRTQEDKAKVLETVISYGLHELLDCEFIRDLIEQMSVYSTTSSLKKDVCAKDGYDVFNWAVWPRFKKHSITNIPRSDKDVITTVTRLIGMGLSPFKVNVKNESIFKTMEVAMGKGLITPETVEVITSMILGISDVDFITRIMRPNFNIVFTPTEKGHVEKSVLMWGFTRKGVSEEIAQTFFDRDLDYCSSVEVDRPNAKLFMTANTIQLLKIIQEGSQTEDFTEYFSKNKITTKMISDFASLIISKFFGVIDRIQECTIDGVYDSTSDRILYKTLQSFGGIIGELGKFVSGFSLSEEQLGKMCSKMKIGYMMVAGTKTSATKSFLETIYNDKTTKMTQKIEIENLCTRLGLVIGNVPQPVKHTATSVKTASVKSVPVKTGSVKTVPVKSSSLSNFNVLDSWEDACDDEISIPIVTNPYTGKVNISLSKVKATDKVEVREGALYPCIVEDNAYSLTLLANKNDKTTHHQLAYEIVLIASEALTHDSQINGFVTMMNYLDDKKVLDKSLIKKVIEDNEEEIRDASDNPKIGKFFTIVKNDL